MMNPFSLENSTALVTGSSRGIGLAIGVALQNAGAEVIFHGTRYRPLDIPNEAHYLPCDLLEAEAPRELIQAALHHHPKLNLLVGNAGSFFDVPFLQMTRERWDQTIQLNLTATYFLVQEFARHLVENKKPGAVVIISSTNGFQAESDSTAYDTSKGGLIMLTKSLALALAPHQIRVNGIAPGLIRTPLTEGWLNERADLREHYEKKVLLGRIGQPEDCAGAAVFLCSPAAGYITGHVVTVDGGLTVGQVGKV